MPGLTPCSQCGTAPPESTTGRVVCRVCFTVDDIDPATGAREVIGVAAIRTRQPGSTSVQIEAVREGLAVVGADGVVQVVDLGSSEVVHSWGTLNP